VYKQSLEVVWYFILPPVCRRPDSECVRSEASDLGPFYSPNGFLRPPIPNHFWAINGDGGCVSGTETTFDHNFKRKLIRYWIRSLQVAFIPGATSCCFSSEYWSEIKYIQAFNDPDTNRKWVKLANARTSEAGQMRLLYSTYEGSDVRLERLVWDGPDSKWPIKAPLFSGLPPNMTLTTKNNIFLTEAIIRCSVVVLVNM